VIAVFVADDPVVDCVLVVAPAPVTSANAKPIANAAKNILIAKAKIIFLIIPPDLLYQQFHFRKDLLILLLGSLAVLADVLLFFMPSIRAQNDLRRLAALLPFFNLEGFVVTAVFNLEPGLALR
jgi:hypothetical protein